MSNQLLINVLDLFVPPGGLTAPHGLRSNDKPVRPTLVMPMEPSHASVYAADETNVYLTNATGVDVHVALRCEHDLSIQADTETLTQFLMGTGTTQTPVESVSASSPLYMSGPPQQPTVNLGQIGTANLLDSAVTPQKTNPTYIRGSATSYTGSSLTYASIASATGVVEPSLLTITAGEPGLGESFYGKIVNSTGATQTADFRITINGASATFRVYVPANTFVNVPPMTTRQKLSLTGSQTALLEGKVSNAGVSIQIDQISVTISAS